MGQHEPVFSDLAVTPYRFLVFSRIRFFVTCFFAFLLSAIVPLQGLLCILYGCGAGMLSRPLILLAFSSTIVWLGQLLTTVYRFKVMDDERLSDDLAAWACFRLDRLQPGLRLLHLYDSNGVLTKGVILVRIKKTVSRV
jgi:hypothetical protein